MKVLLKIASSLLIASLLLSAGCGGGGGGGGSSNDVSFFVTDDLNAGYDAVWVTVEKVELLTSSGAVTVFDDPNGVVMNVRALNVGGQTHFAHLGANGVPSGDYTGVRVTLDDDVVVFPTGQSTGQALVFAGLTGTDKIISYSFGAPRPIAGSDDLIIDFKLQDWTINGSQVENATLADGSSSGLNDPNRHEEDQFKGTISGLSGSSPNFTFTLNMEHGMTVSVMTNSQTAYFNSDGSANPTLANGKRVHVRGKYSPSEKAVIAASIRIKPNQEPEDPHEVKGPTSEVDLLNGKFRVAIREAEGFVPTGDSLIVQTDLANTRFFSHGGIGLSQAEFFAILQAKPGIWVEAEGTVTGSGPSAILTATKVKIEEEDEHDEAEAEGNVTAFDAGAGTWVMSLREWEGFVGQVGMLLNVATDSETEFIGDNGQPVTKEQFFLMIAMGTRVEVKGDLNGGTFLARRAKVEDGNDDPAEARGTVSSINAGAFSFDLVLSHWEGFSGSAGMTLHVATTGNTTFRALNGSSMTRDAFFAALTTGAIVEAEGTFNSGTTTLTAVKAKFED